MSKGIEVRLARHDDIASVLHLQHASHEVPRWDAARYLGMLETNLDPLQRELWVAIASNSSIIGFAVIAVVLEDAEIESVVVDHAWRRRGVGCALMGTVIASAKKMGATTMRLEVRQSNDVAQDFYASHGFVPRGTRRGYYGHPVEDAVLMFRTIV